MFTIRPADEGDRDEIAGLFRARSVWMREQELEGWEGWEGWGERADSLAAQAGNPDSPVWVLTEGPRITGVTTLYEESPAWCWTETERAEPGLFLATTATHPDYAGRRVGCLIAWWSLDHAYQRGMKWVRRGTGPYPALVRYYTDIQGWRVVRTVERQGVTAYALTRQAEPRPDLPVLTTP